MCLNFVHQFVDFEFWIELKLFLMIDMVNYVHSTLVYVMLFKLRIIRDIQVWFCVNVAHFR